MIPRLLKTSSSSSQPLSYNETKVVLGEAEIVAVRNISAATMFRARVEMERLEANPSIRSNVKKMGFHLTINPDDNNKIDEAIIIKYIDEMMTQLGYKDQPYVIIKHYDIARVHYHVVSTRVLKNGKLIDNSFSFPKIMQIHKKLTKEYGIPDSLDKKEVTRLSPIPMSKEMKNKIEQIKANVLATAMSTHTGEIQLKAVLRFYGILLERGVSKNGHPYESFYVIDERGKCISRSIPVKEVLGEPFEKFYKKHHLELCFTPKYDSIYRLKRVIEQNNGQNVDNEEFRKRLSKCGFSLYLADKKGNEAKNVADIENVVFFDQKTRVCLNLDDCSLRINDIRRMIGEHESKKQELDLKTTDTAIKIHR
jgi:hypothetical protein